MIIISMLYKSRVDCSKLYGLVITCYLSTLIDEKFPINLFLVFAKFTTVQLFLCKHQYESNVVMKTGQMND